VIQTPLYTAIIQEGTISTEAKAKIAEEITRIHTTVMKVPKNLDRNPRLASQHGP
jgi:phenylpyruvate tautomerase PptA (4-oxalocrotonate tautomerase family)